MKLHVIRCTSKESAKEHVEFQKKLGSEAVIEEVTVYDVYVTRDFRVGDTSLDQR